MIYYCNLSSLLIVNDFVLVLLLLLRLIIAICYYLPLLLALMKPRMGAFLPYGLKLRSYGFDSGKEKSGSLNTVSVDGENQSLPYVPHRLKVFWFRVEADRGALFGSRIKGLFLAVTSIRTIANRALLGMPLFLKITIYQEPERHGATLYLRHFVKP